MVDILNKKFGRLLVIRFSHIKETVKNSEIVWECLCDCGKIHFSTTHLLKYGSVKSCGCLRRETTSERYKIHGRSKTRGYGSWKAMVGRCHNKNHAYYKNYGKRGIVVCDRWRYGENELTGYECFLEDMGERPDKRTLDRIDVNGNYEPSNCRWATNSEQGFNKRKSSKNTSGKTGVEWNKRNKVWTANITINNKRVHLGCFKTFEEAVKAREEMEIQQYGKTKD